MTSFSRLGHDLYNHCQKFPQKSLFYTFLVFLFTIFQRLTIPISMSLRISKKAAGRNFCVAGESLVQMIEHSTPRRYDSPMITGKDKPPVLIFPNATEIARDAAYRFIALSRKAEREGRFFRVALAGGRTPETLYRMLASPEFAGSIDWNKVQLCLGDDRFVPEGSEFSNYSMVKKSLLDPLGIECRYIQTELETPELAADAYEATLHELFDKEQIPCFDLLLLGMGADGHCASLFPGKASLHETQRLVTVGEPGLNPFVPRITLTFPVINAAANVIFMVTGEDKAETLLQVLEGNYRPTELPAQKVSPQQGNLVWLVDLGAASKILQTRG